VSSVAPQALQQRRENNVSSLRIIGALLVLFGHSFSLSGNSHPMDPVSSLVWNVMPWKQQVQTMGVILFFGLSGYLVTQSYLGKKHLLDYLVARVARIYPALIVAVMFCVFIVGPLYTTQSLGDYAADPMTHQYLWVNSTLKSVRFSLPGVFDNRPVASSVNGSLWTLPVEFRFYLIVAALGVTGILRVPRLFNAIALAGLCLFLRFPGIFPNLWCPPKPYLLLAFVTGMAYGVNHYKPDVMLLVCLLVCCAIGWHRNYYHLYEYLALTTFVTFAIYLGFYCSLRLPRLDRFGDFSYGIYLYAFPLQQMAVGWVGTGKPWLVFFISLALSLALGAISWHCIEAPMIKSGRKLIHRFHPPATP